MRSVHGEPSCHLATPELDLDLTLRAGHVAPVVFHLPGRDVSPYAMAPWTPDEFPDLPPLLSVLRGDFLCLPFGGIRLVGRRIGRHGPDRDAGDAQIQV